MLPPLHVVTDDAVLADPGFPERARSVIAAGGAELALHLRGPRTAGRRLFELAAALAPAARASGARLLVNDRLDVALAAGGDGVQLGARSIGVADARRTGGAGLLIGASVHTAAEALAAARAGADFLLVGTLFATASHPGRAGRGVAAVAEAIGAGVPCVGIGGITPERVAEVRGAGAAGVAAIRAVWAAPAPEREVDRFLERWKAR